MTITLEQRQTVKQRARNCCEYCRVAQGDRLSKFQVDHIIPRKHGGTDDTDNLCLACLKCNSFKGPNVASLDPETGEATKLYNPRQQNWTDHFEIHDTARIAGKSPEGRATVVVLRLNDTERVTHRWMALQSGTYPC